MANWGNALGGGTAGALGGAASGAALGSLFPGVGTGIGALVGGGLGALGGSAPGLLDQNQQSLQPGQVPGSQTGNFLTGYNGYNQQLPRFTQEQQSALSQLLSQGLGNSNFQGIENRARQNFSNKTVPSLAERFASLGSGGSQRSSAFTGALGSAASDLESQLAALRGQYGLQQLGLGLTPSFENIYIPQQGGLLQGAAPGIGQLLGQLPQLFQLQQLISSMQANKVGAK